MAGREWILLNPGPANTSPRVRQALLTPDLCHREPEFFEVMRECRERLVRLLDAPAFGAVLFTGSGTAAVEASVASAVPEGGALLIVDNGVYG
ncbi:MAG TPA: 2-aminoethylphosphonate aminotransferase, partial [Methylomirabilota bacterium]|nr:2-aminoethylphosphonate aminotransferase [Methylomirabilota bacterium]